MELITSQQIIIHGDCSDSNEEVAPDEEGIPTPNKRGVDMKNSFEVSALDMNETPVQSVIPNQVISTA